MHEQQELALSPQLTEWMAGAPPTLGWYNTKLRYEPDECAVRRFFKGGHTYSKAALIDHDYTQEELQALIQRDSALTAWQLVFQGLRQPAPEGYPYDVVSTSSRVLLISAAPQAVPTPRRKLNHE